MPQQSVNYCITPDVKNENFRSYSETQTQVCSYVLIFQTSTLALNF